jgi:hypothetical protein
MREFAFGQLAQVQQAGEEIGSSERIVRWGFGETSVLRDELTRRMDPGELLRGDIETLVDEQMEIVIQEDENERASV